MQCVVLAGGQGSRLKGICGDTPKHLVQIGNKPFADYQLKQIERDGFTRVTYALSHGADQIIRYLTTQECKMKFDYAVDGPTPLGTGGALRNLLDHDLLDEVFAVTYGDTLLSLKPKQMFELLSAIPIADGVISIWKNNDYLERSNCAFDGQWVTQHEKKSDHDAIFEWIDYGMTVFRSDIIRRKIPPNTYMDLSELIKVLAIDGTLLGFEVHNRFYEIGTPSSLRETEEYLSGTSRFDEV